MLRNEKEHSPPLSHPPASSLREGQCAGSHHPRMENIASLRNESDQTKPIFLGADRASSKKTPREIFLTNFARRLSQPLVICNHIIWSGRVDN